MDRDASGSGCGCCLKTWTVSCLWAVRPTMGQFELILALIRANHAPV